MVDRTNDMEAVAAIFSHPKVKGWSGDDLPGTTYTPNPSGLFLMNEEKTGVALIIPFNSVTCMVHIGALPELWGRTAGFVKEGIAWLFKNTHYVKVVSFTAECNRAALALGKRCGFKEEGRSTKSCLKNWELHDQIIMGLSKYDKEGLWKQQEQQ